MSELPWQAGLLAGLRQRLAAERLPHALLVCGPDGWGEAELSNRLALDILGLEGDREAAELAHPDLRWLVPDGAVIKVDAVRELVAFSHGTPQAAARKVAVVADAHFLNDNAANALLKTLEEPPPRTHLLLFTAHPRRLLPTIRSRCQQVTIRPDAEAAVQWLQAGAPGRELDRHLFEYGGAPVAVWQALQREEQPLDGLLELAFDRRTPVDTVVAALLEAGLADALARWYRYALALAAGDWRPPGLNPPPARQIHELADELIWGRRLLVTSNSANARLIAERLVARWRHLARAAA